MPSSLNFLLLLTTAGLATELAAQERAAVPFAVRVRVTTDAGRIVGRWGGLANDSITILGARDSAKQMLPVHRVRIFELSRGRVTRTGRGALIGLASGTGLGVASGLALCLGGRCDSSGGDFGGFITLVFAGIGALGGTGIGALIGSQVHSERWWRMPLQGMRVSLISPGQSRLNLGLRVYWAR